LNSPNVRPVARYLINSGTSMPDIISSVIVWNPGNVI